METPIPSCVAERLLGSTFYNTIQEPDDPFSNNRVRCHTGSMKNLNISSPLRRVTIKVLPKSSVGQTEINILRSIAYMSSVQTFYGEYESPTEVRRIVELCELGDLAHLVWKRSVPTPIAYRLFNDLCHAVADLHDVGICHRNIGLRSILLAGDGTIRLTNFGFAHQHEMDLEFKYRDDTPLYHRCGYVDTMGPEMVAGAPYSGEKVDSWAIGVVFFTLLMGGAPFQIASDDDPGFRYLKTMGVRAFLSAWPGLSLPLSNVHHIFLLEHLLEAHEPAKRLTARDIRHMTRSESLVSSFTVMNFAREAPLLV